MQRLLIALGLVCLVLAGFTGCGPSEEELAAQEDEQHRQQLQDLQQQEQALNEMRAELADLRAQLEATADGEETDGGDETGDEATAEEPPEDPAARIAQLEGEVQEAAEKLYTDVGNFLNEEVPMLEGEEPTDIQKAALRIKSNEDMVLAREYIVEGGDYKRAISIYQAALQVDPDNEDLEAALAEAEANRFMTEERLSQVEKGMNEEEVREVLGRPIHYNIREYEEGGQLVTGWFYPKSENGDAAAVFFRQRRGEFQVYKIDFNAVEGRTEDEDEG